MTLALHGDILHHMHGGTCTNLYGGTCTNLYGGTCTNLYTSKTTAIGTTVRATYKIVRLCQLLYTSLYVNLYWASSHFTLTNYCWLLHLYTRQEDLQRSSPQGPFPKVLANSYGIIAVGFCGHQLCICG